MRYRTQAITVAELEGRREEVLTPLPPPPFKPVGVFLLLVWHRHSLPTTGSHITTQLMFSLVTGGGEGLRKGGISRRKLRSNFGPPIKKFLNPLCMSCVISDKYSTCCLYQQCQKCRVSKQKMKGGKCWARSSNIERYYSLITTTYKKSAYVRSPETCRLEKTLHWMKANLNPFKSYC